MYAANANLSLLKYAYTHHVYIALIVNYPHPGGGRDGKGESVVVVGAIPPSPPTNSNALGFGAYPPPPLMRPSYVDHS